MIKILYIFSIVGAIVGIFYGYSLMTIQDMSTADMQSALSMAGFANDDVMLGQIMSLSRMWPWFIVFNIVELVGLILMMRSNRIGLHFYAAAQVGLSALMIINFGVSASLVSIIWNVLWVVVYFRFFPAKEEAEM